MKNFESFEMFTERYGGSTETINIMYHGTSKDNIHSILKNGLLARPKNRMWSREKSLSYSSFDTPTVASLDGVYFTNAFQTAIEFSSYVTENTSSSVIVITKIQTRSLLMDEDDIPPSLEDLKHHCDIRPEKVLDYYRYLIGDKRYVSDDEFEHTEKIYIWSCISDSGTAYVEDPNPNHIARYRKLLARAFELSIKRAASHLLDTTLPDNIQKSAQGVELPSTADAESEFLNLKGEVTALLKTHATIIKGTKLGKAQNGRLIDDVNYSGANKILCIIEIQGNDESEPPVNVVVHYGEIPIETKQLLKSKYGKVKITKARK